MNSNHHNGGSAKPHPMGAPSLARSGMQTPEEALGLTSGKLLSSCIIATGMTTLVLAVLTVGPYFLAGKAQVNAAENNPTPAKPEEQTPPDQPKPTPTGTQPTTAKPTGSETPKPTPNLLDKLGENGTKTTKPSVNPLDKKDDDIFKDLK